MAVCAAVMGSPRVRFSRRQWEVLTLLAEGLRHKEIADRLGVSMSCVHNLATKAFAKLAAGNAFQAGCRYEQKRRENTV